MLANPTQQTYRFKSFSLAAVVIFFVLGLAALGGLLVYKYFNRSVVEEYFASNRPFGVLVTGETTGDKTRAVRFLSVVTLWPNTGRIGFISFFPQMKLDKKGLSMGEMVLKNTPKETTDTLATILGIEIPFYFSVNTDDMVRFIDLIEGIPFFLQSSDKLKGESLPTGEFYLDGLLTEQLLNPPEQKNEYSPAFRLFRYYSLILNLWKNRSEKWVLLKPDQVLNIAVSGVKTNFSAKEMFFLGDTLFTEKRWLPMLMEVPVKRIKDDFLIDSEATALYLKNYLKQLSQKENPFASEPPKMEVKNGTMVASLARETRVKLSRKGIQVLEFANADHSDYPHTILLDTNGNAFYLESISKMLGIKKAYYAINRAYFTDAILILGNDYKKLTLEK